MSAHRDHASRLHEEEREPYARDSVCLFHQCVDLVKVSSSKITLTVPAGRGDGYSGLSQPLRAARQCLQHDHPGFFVGFLPAPGLISTKLVCLPMGKQIIAPLLQKEGTCTRK